jgi:flagellin
VTASAFTQVDITIPAATLTADASVSAAINGANITTDADPTMAELVTLINAEKDHTGVTAEAHGEVLRLSGAVSAINVTDVLNGGTTGLNSSLPATTHYGSIRLESSDGTPIRIDTAATSVVAEHGFLNMNAGAADFDTNDSYLPSSGSLVSGMNVASVAAAQATLTTVDNAIQQVSNSAASLGAVQNRLEHVVSNLSEGIVNTEAAKSRIMDADFAVESARLAKQQVLQQASTAMLAQANASVQSVLTLLGG